MSNHTPGRWFNGENYVFSDNELVENNPTVVCRAATAEDACLIAAAPDLLKALEIVEPIIDDVTESVEPGRMIRAAIAKARGEE